MNLMHLLLYPVLAAVPLMLVVGCDEGDAGAASAMQEDDHGDEEGTEEHADEVMLTGEAIERYGIVVATVEARALDAVVIAPARVAFNAEAMAHVGSLVSGRVAEIKVRLGDQVAKGDVLLVIESPELGQLQGNYLSALSAVSAATPAVEIARSSYDRAQKLFDETEGGGVTLNEVQRREAELKTAEREVATADAGVTAAANTLRLHGMTDAQIDTLAESKKVAPTYEVIAPIAGEVVEREVTPGELVSPDDESLMVLADMTSVWVLVDVAESKLGSVGVGSSATITVTAMQDQTFEGHVTYVDPRVNAASRTARLRVEVKNPEDKLHAGLFASAAIGPAGGSGNAVPAVPAEAVMEIEGEPSVFVPVEGEPNTFARRAVMLGQRVGDFYPVLDGVDVGDQIVVTGVFILKAELGKAGVEHAH